jgi:hypothetical protein
MRKRESEIEKAKSRKRKRERESKKAKARKRESESKKAKARKRKQESEKAKARKRESESDIERQIGRNRGRGREEARRMWDSEKRDGAGEGKVITCILKLILHS